MRIGALCLVTCAVLFLAGPWAKAGQSVGCDAVQNMATVEADDTLSINITKDKPTKTCVFHVELPPSTSATATPQQKAADFALRFFAKPDEKQIVEEFVPALQDAMFYQVKLGNFEATSVETWANAVNASIGVLAACSVDSFVFKKGFTSYSDSISCGAMYDKGYFVVETKSPTLSSALYLPLK